MKVVIIDDELKARNLLRVLLEENCPQITEIHEACDLPSGVAKINKESPDIVFLDIEMPGYSGIQILDFFTPDQITFQIIFTTAYSEYAIKAFELNAIDYLLKPLRDEQLEVAVNKAITQIDKSRVSERLEELKNTLHVNNIRKIGLPVSNGVLFVALEEIIMMEADRMYTRVFTRSSGELLVSKPLKFFVQHLEQMVEFYKPHRSYLINLKHIKQYVNQDGGYIIMDNEKSVNISKDKKDEFFEVMNH
ncbi:LytR/AlgR family response regulator transcription factor [Marinoscillum furvescens]|uniref:LytTR family two component transcriptional regulator n=1 Tax=Marinoscillum furvescens DSM 4134 TaxID=1122208 RepID=A0A3D9L497_MARFU|nr:response regulator [Marinoscillum furvescens]RED98904.1 LytTR family two component transcriptional regulator [Marinoscillum furvescens DSM 4134]